MVEEGEVDSLIKIQLKKSTKHSATEPESDTSTPELSRTAEMGDDDFT